MTLKIEPTSLVMKIKAETECRGLEDLALPTSIQQGPWLAFPRSSDPYLADGV